MSYQGVSHVSHESFSPPGPPSQEYPSDMPLPQPLPPRQGYDGYPPSPPPPPPPGYQGYKGLHHTGAGPPLPHSSSYGYPHANGCLSFLRAW
ncbi:hypothetical protein Ancab_018196 [Ancistrocladus abbreviatus]